MGDDYVFRRMYFEVILHAFYVNDLRKADPEKFTIRPDEYMIALYGPDLSGSCFENFSVYYLVDCFGKTFIRNRLQQIINHVEFVTLQSIFRIRGRKHNKR